MLRLLTASLLALTLTACGDDEVVADAATTDAQVADASGPDAPTQSACEVLCDCATTYCGTQFPDLNTCLTDCAALDSATRACRIEHCGYAQSDSLTHCPHVAGDRNNNTTPEACLGAPPDAGVSDAGALDAAP